MKPFTPRLLGYNFDWEGQSQLFLAPDRLMVDPKVAEGVGNFPLPLNRVAGTCGQELSWKGAIGPLAERTEQKLYEWAPTAKVVFGPVEWIRWIRGQQPGAELCWVLNLRTDSPQDAADLVEFLTGDGSENPNGGVNWADKRREYGLPDPVKVAVWEIGNEMDHVEYRWDLERYLAAARPVIDAIRAVDPKAKIALQGSTRFDRQWNRGVLASLGAKADYLVAHYYYQGRQPPELTQGFSGHRISVMERWMDEVREDIRQVTGEERIKMYVSEYAYWPWRVKGREWKETWWLTHSLDACLANARMITRFLNRPEIAMGNYHSFSAGPWWLFGRDEKTGVVYGNGVAELFRLLGRLESGEVVSVETSGLGTDVAADDGSFYAAAVRNGRQIQALLVNRGAARTISLKTAERSRAQQAWILTAADLDAQNSPERKPIAVAPYPLPTGGKAGDAITLNIPRYAVVLVNLEPDPGLE